MKNRMWQTYDGKLVNIRDLTTRHLENIVKSLEECNYSFRYMGINPDEDFIPKAVSDAVRTEKADMRSIYENILIELRLRKHELLDVTHCNIETKGE